MKLLAATVLIASLAPNAALALQESPQPLADTSAEAAEMSADILDASADLLDSIDESPPSDPLKLTDQAIREAAKGDPSYRSYPVPLLQSWETALRKAIGTQSLNAASRDLAKQFDLPVAQMKTLSRLWLTADVNQYLFTRAPHKAAQLRGEFLKLVRASDHHPLLVEAAADSIGKLTDSWMGDCEVADYEALWAGSRTPAADAWRIANVASCESLYLRVAQSFPDLTTPAVFRMVDSGSIEGSAVLPAYEWLIDEAKAGRFGAETKDAILIRLYRAYANELFNRDLTDHATSMIESLPSESRARAIAGKSDTLTIHLADALSELEAKKDDGDLALNMAASSYLRGRRDEAENILADVPGFAEAKRNFACTWKSVGPAIEDCGTAFSLPLESLVLDHLLHAASSDPYPIAEYLIATDRHGLPSGPLVDLRCELFVAEYAPICKESREAMVSALQYRQTSAQNFDDAFLSTLDALARPGWAEARASTRDDIAAIAKLAAALDAPVSFADREAIEPDPPAFASHPLPERFRSAVVTDAPEWPAAFAALPQGFGAVRWEAEGNRAVAISLSSDYDPTGEISGGGYWVHMSDDGGHSWQSPIYTGLAEHFPYVVKPTSLMNMLDGDALHVEVAIAQIDTRSITYPPVGLRTSRTEDNLYLDLPLADLRRDSNGDGLSDIAEHHLLLDRSGTAATPYLVGRDGEECTSAPSEEASLRALVLKELLGIESRALIEPVDRTDDLDMAFGQWRRTGDGARGPIFLHGDPADFACLRPDTPMIVYSDADIAELQRHTPDFRTIELPKIIINRARDRGYLIWSAGWTGGTYRLTRKGETWSIKAISSWIT